MNLSSLPLCELRKRLRHPGIKLQIGPFAVHLRSPIRQVADSLKTLYADFFAPEESDFADFYVELVPPANPRRWFRRQVLFSFDGRIPFKPLPIQQAAPLFEWGLNWCVANHAHWYLVLHAAVVERNGWAAVLPGSPGSGKSTLCAALVNRGWRLFSDELTLIGNEAGHVIPLVRPISLKNQSIDLIRKFAPKAVFGPVVHDTNKGSVALMKAPLESIARCYKPAWPAWIIFPKYVPGSPVRLEPRTKGRAMLTLVQNALNYNVLGAEGFYRLIEVVDRCECYDFRYSSLEEAVRSFEALSPSVSSTR